MKLAKEILPYNMSHNAETEACDLLMEIEHLQLLDNYVDENSFHRVCLYLTRCCRTLNIWVCGGAIFHVKVSRMRVRMWWAHVLMEYNNNIFIYGGPQVARQKRNAHCIKEKLVSRKEKLIAKKKTSWQKRKAHSKKNLMAKKKLKTYGRSKNSGMVGVTN